MEETVLRMSEFRRNPVWWFQQMCDTLLLRYYYNLFRWLGQMLDRNRTNVGFKK